MILLEQIDQLYKDIIGLEVQGATNVALAVLEGVIIASRESNADIISLEAVGKRLAYARPTEPLAQNAVRFVFDKKDQPLEYYLSKIEEWKNLMAEAKEKMAKEGSKLIEDGGLYLTHCHSSTVTSMFMAAHKTGKRFSVIATETRPKFQGRITVKELLDAGIEDVTLIIDDTAESLLEGKMKHIDAVFIGADLLSQNGFVNKIGSLGIAYAAQRAKIPLYSMSILLKYDPRPFSVEFIEIRNKKEVWEDAPRDLQIYSPAFDFVPYDTGVKIVSEKGIIEGKTVTKAASSSYPFLR